MYAGDFFSGRQFSVKNDSKVSTETCEVFIHDYLLVIWFLSGPRQDQKLEIPFSEPVDFNKNEVKGNGIRLVFNVLIDGKKGAIIQSQEHGEIILLINE